MRALALGVLLVGCGRPVAQLDRPALVRSVETGFCGTTLALDAKSEIWSEAGCENGAIVLHGRGRASDASAQALREQFERLRAGVECAPADGGVSTDRRVSFRVLGVEGDEEWQECPTVGPEPWTAVNAAFDAL